MRRFAAASLLLLASITAATAQDPGVYIPPDATECWGCHGPGVDHPDMDPSYDVALLATDMRAGQTSLLRFELLNTWLGDILDITASLDLADTGLEIAAAPIPAHETVLEGALPSQPPPEVPSPGSAPTLPPRQETLQAAIPDGSTAVRIQLLPDDRDPVTGPDLALEVAPERSAEPYHADNAGRGGAETVRFADLDAVVAAGYGDWTFHVRPGDDHMTPTAAPYRIEVTAWTNTTGQTEAVLTAPGPVQPGAKVLLTVPVALAGSPEPGAHVHLAVNATYHWEHDTKSYPDYGYFHVPFDFPIVSERGETSFGTASGATVAPAVQGVSLARLSEAIGYLSGSLLLVSFVTGGVLGKANRRHLNVVFGSARRRVAYHNFVSYGLTAAALAHLILFLVEIDWHWAHGIMWGGTSLLAMFGLGVTGAMQVPLIRRWNYRTWRRVHLSLAVVTLATAVGHMLLDGANFAWVQDALGYDDPFVPDA